MCDSTIFLLIVFLGAPIFAGAVYLMGCIITIHQEVSAIRNYLTRIHDEGHTKILNHKKKGK